MNTIAHTELNAFRLCLGGSVFGWTVDERTSFRILDAYVAAGGNFIDTADSYSQWTPGNSGGESEFIIGRWLASRKIRDDMIIATKVGRKIGLSGLAPRVINQAVDESLRRLGTDRIDVYYAHADDPETPLEVTLTALDALIKVGKVRHIAASNMSGARLTEALTVSRRAGLAAYVAVQPPYNLMEREPCESDLLPVCAREGLSCVPYFALAQGFLTGKYRAGAPVTNGARSAAAQPYASTQRGRAVVRALVDIAAGHGVAPAAVALAWLAARPHVTAPLASSRTPEQLTELISGAHLELSSAEMESLQLASCITD
ncbi:aldo/keto reductase [Streptomyces cyaneofuscatus]|uniref:aldo/keto reductase n=1 Tax=Streptomyces cyaneofuscatus TaxID=66883 RepID=UPI0033B8C522